MNKSALHLVWQESWKWILLDILAFILGIEAISRTLYKAFTYTATELTNKSVYIFNLHFDIWDIVRLIIGTYLIISSINGFKRYYKKYKELNTQ